MTECRDGWRQGQLERGTEQKMRGCRKKPLKAEKGNRPEEEGGTNAGKDESVG